MVLVSVVMPVCNMQETIEVALDSIEAQTYSDVEIVVVDDGSTDETVGRVHSFATRSNRDVRIIGMPHSGIPAIARNLGLAQVRGLYVQFLDADDEIHPDKVMTQLALLADNDLLGKGAAYSDYVFFRQDENGRRHEERRGPPDGEYWPMRPVAQFEAYTVIHRFLLPLAPVVRVGCFDGTLTHGEDLDLWLKLLSVGTPFLYHPDVHAYYRERYGHSLRHPDLEKRCRARVAARLTHYVDHDQLDAAARLQVAGLDRWARGELGDRD